MSNTSIQVMIPDEVIINKIYFIRGQNIMLDRDLAELYGVETKYLKRQVKRNMVRFPDDFMFELTKDEYDSLRSQIGTLKRGEHSKFLPFAFTEDGVSQLSTVLKSERAIITNLQIMRLFGRMRKMLLTHKDILLKLEQIERKITGQDNDIKLLFNALKQLLNPPIKLRNPMGYKLPKPQKGKKKK